MSREPEHPHRLDDAVRLRRERREQWQREGERPLGRNLALIGTIGWTVVIPTLLGIFAGRWLDRRLGSGLMWTLGLLLLGIVVGCVLAWKRIQRE